MIGIILAAAIAAGPGPYPTEYDNLVRSYLEENLKDPTSAIIKETRGPHRMSWHSGGGLLGGPRRQTEGYAVCYKVNAKNSYGAYVGNKTYMFMIVDGAVWLSRSSPYFNSYSGREMTDQDVESECSNPADPTPVPAPKKGESI